MKPARSFFKMLAYPVTRPLGDITGSMRGIKKTADEARRRLAEKRSDADAAQSYLKAFTPAERFEEVYRLNAWTQPEMESQKKAARRTRLGSVAVAMLAMFLLLWVVMTANFFLAILTFVGLVAFTAACIAQAIRFAWWEDQLSRRVIYPLGEFIARPDLFNRALLP